MEVLLLKFYLIRFEIELFLYLYEGFNLKKRPLQVFDYDSLDCVNM